MGAKFGVVLDKSTGRVRELGRDDKGRPFGAMIVRPDFYAPTDGREKKTRPVAVNRQRVPVTLGLIENQFAEIISGDLREGQELVIGTQSGSPK